MWTRLSPIFFGYAWCSGGERRGLKDLHISLDSKREKKNHYAQASWCLNSIPFPVRCGKVSLFPKKLCYFCFKSFSLLISGLSVASLPSLKHRDDSRQNLKSWTTRNGIPWHNWRANQPFWSLLEPISLLLWFLVCCCCCSIVFRVLFKISL